MWHGSCISTTTTARHVFDTSPARRTLVEGVGVRELRMQEELASASALSDEMITHTVGVSERYRRLQ